MVYFFSIFIIAIAAAEAAVAIAIIINLYRNYNSIDVEDATEMKFLNFLLHEYCQLFFNYFTTTITWFLL
jgi:hypothetical protein